VKKAVTVLADKDLCPMRIKSKFGGRENLKRAFVNEENRIGRAQEKLAHRVVSVDVEVPVALSQVVVEKNGGVTGKPGRSLLLRFRKAVEGENLKLSRAEHAVCFDCCVHLSKSETRGQDEFTVFV
jgi:hypothetical protein